MKRAAASFRDAPADPIEEVTIGSRSKLTILRALGSDYYLCVVIGRDSIAGHARYEIWRAGLQLQEAIG